MSLLNTPSASQRPSPFTIVVVPLIAERQPYLRFRVDDYPAQADEGAMVHVGGVLVLDKGAPDGKLHIEGPHKP